MVKTIVGSFDGYPTARRVARELMDEGYMFRDIGIMAGNASGDYRAGTDDDKGSHTTHEQMIAVPPLDAARGAVSESRTA